MKQKPLKPTEKAFAIAYAETGNGRKSIDIAYKGNTFTEGTKRVKAVRLLTKDNVMTEIANRKAVMEANANLAAERIQQIITHGKEHNALVASMFAYEQVEGKAKQVTEVKSEHVSVVYDLSGGAGGEIPEHIKQQLEQK